MKTNIFQKLTMGRFETWMLKSEFSRAARAPTQLQIKLMKLEVF